MRSKLPRFLITLPLITIVSVVILLVFLISNHLKTQALKTQFASLTAKEIKEKNKLVIVEKELKSLRSQDQYVKNKNLEEQIKNIERTYKKAVTSYEKLLDFKNISKKTDKFDKLLANSLDLLSQRSYASADATLISLNKQIEEETAKIASTFAIPQNVPSSNTPPSSGFSRQQVQSDKGTFLVDIITADLNSARVIVDTASDSDCKDNCPVLALADYVARSGAFAGINGSYFCPASYPSCSGKTNSFDLLVMNKNKKYFNSGNNVYSTNPAVIFSGNSVRFVSRALEWGRDTGVDAVISNFPLLVSNNQIVYDGSSDPKFNSRGPRGFVANNASTAYIGFVYNATMEESAHALKALNVNNAMNLDEGGSTALWFGGYKAGPGRNIPNAILFVRK